MRLQGAATAVLGRWAGPSAAPTRPDLDTVIVLAKSPRPGRVKTRLSPVFTPNEAALLAAASIRDTLDAAHDTGARTVVAWDGPRTPWLKGDRVEVLDQRGDGLGERLDAALHDALGHATDRPTLLVGMDTPQISATDLRTDWHGADAVLGLSQDGGYWAIGLRRYRPGLFDGVPMSTDHTGPDQLARLRACGLTVHLLPPMRDIDEPEDAEAVAALVPGTRFARTYRRIVAAPCDPTALWDAALAGRAVDVFRPGSAPPEPSPLDVAAWRSMSPVDELVVSRCTGPVIDIGCGPGRFVEALAARGIPALGIDLSTASVGQTRARGGSALLRDVFRTLPAEGRWRTLLLADGNIGIGADPVALLSRCRELLSPEGAAVIEVDEDEGRDERSDVTLHGPVGRTSVPFPWAQVGSAALTRYAAAAGLLPMEDWRAAGRAFVVLRPAA